MAASSVIRAAGGVLWRHAAGGTGNDDIQVAVIHRPRYNDWTIPKGKLNRGEIELEGAVREVNEETGYRVIVGRPLGEVGYVKDGRPKIVHYWAMRAEGGVFIPTREVDELRWLSVPEAAALLTVERDRDLLSRFANGPATTKAVMLVRHGSAGSRSGFPGEDLQRPLDDAGREQSDSLVWLLTRFDIREIYSAHPVRCVQTVEPLSRSVGLPVQIETLISEEAYYGREREALAFLRSVGSEGTGTVLCSQGGVIPDILRRIADEDAYELPEIIQSKKGSIWSLTFSGGGLVAAEYFPPLA